MTNRKNKARLLAALKKPILNQNKIDEINAQAIRKNLSPTTPLPRRLVSFLFLYREATGVLADGMTVWPMLGVTTCLGAMGDWLFCFWQAS